MDILNNDCQLLILKYLTLKDQLHLFEATKKPKNRLHSNLQNTWQHYKEFTLDDEHFEVFNESPELLHDFISLISSNVQQLNLRHITLDILQKWKRYNFPKMRSLILKCARTT